MEVLALIFTILIGVILIGFFLSIALNPID